MKIRNLIFISSEVNLSLNFALEKCMTCYVSEKIRHVFFNWSKIRRSEERKNIL